MYMYIKKYLHNPKDAQELTLTDLYPNGINLKEITQDRRGIGMHVEFDNNIPLQINFVIISFDHIYFIHI